MGLCNALCSKSDAQYHYAPDTQTKRLTSNASAEPVSFTPNWEHRQSFHNAVKKGNCDMLTYYKGEESTVDLLNSKYNEETPLHNAVKYKQYQVMEYLLENEANPNIGDDTHGDTPLHIACRNGDLRAVKILCLYFANTNIENEYEETVLSIALQQDTKQHREIASYLEPNDKKRYKLQKTLEEKQLDTFVATQMANDVLVYVDNDIDGGNEWLTGQDTGRLSAITNELLDDVQSEYYKKMKSLGPLASWLERQQYSPPYSWLKRWVVVQNGYLLWSDREMTINNNVVDKQERRRWNKCMHLRTVKEIKKKEGKKHTKFMVKAQNREYIFKAESKDVRDYWVNNLRQHVEIAKMQRNPMVKDEVTDAPLSKLNSIL